MTGSVTDEVHVERFAAFADDPDSGNPARMVLDAVSLSAGQMQEIAVAVGYSETAFVTGPICRDAAVPVRYFAPEGEVSPGRTPPG